VPTSTSTRSRRVNRKGWILVVTGVALAGCAGLGVTTLHNLMTFECKSRASEAKTNLSGLFTAEKSFFGEYGVYSSDLVTVNWSPDGSPGYVYGFAKPGPGVEREEANRLKLDGYDE